jgi:hypothetical protein
VVVTEKILNVLHSIFFSNGCHHHQQQQQQPEGLSLKDHFLSIKFSFLKLVCCVLQELKNYKIDNSSQNNKDSNVVSILSQFNIMKH